MNALTKERKRVKMDILQSITQDQLRSDLPQLFIGDTVKVYVKVKEGSKERIQMFEGTIISKKHGGIQESFTVRRVSYGVGVERTFPVNSPIIDRIEKVRGGKVRRAKLYYLRDRVGKAAKVKEKI
jgi:large subunit ribosomal protein L19